MDDKGGKIDNLSSYSLSAKGGRKESGNTADFPIPERYYVNTLVVLPVNPSLVYFYWDMDIETEERVSRVGFQNLVLVVYALKGSDKLKVGEIKVSSPEGGYYWKRYLGGETITAELGVEMDGNVVPVCYGNVVSIPRDTFSKEEAEMIWMKKIEEGHGEEKVLIEASLKMGEEKISSSEHYKIVQQIVKYLLDREEFLSSDSISSSFQQTRSEL